MSKDATLADLVRRLGERRDEHERDIDIMETSYEVESARWKEEAADLGAALDLLRDCRDMLTHLGRETGGNPGLDRLLTRLAEPAGAPTEGTEGETDNG